MAEQGYGKYIEEDARLIVLKELAAQSDGRANETILTAALDAFGHNRSKDWVRTQLNVLEELGAVKNTRVGSVIVSQLTERGLEHVLRRTKIEGVKQPSLGA